MTLYNYLSKINSYAESDSQCPAFHETPEDKDFKALLIEDRLASCPVCAYGVYHKALKENFANNSQKARWQRLWLRHCISQETNYIFAVLKEVEGEANKGPIRVDREGSVKEIAFNSLLNKDGPLSQAIGSEQGIDYYKNVLIKWFLRLYNWKDALLLHLKKKKTFLPSFIAIAIILLSLLMLFFLTKGVIHLKYVEVIAIILMGIILLLLSSREYINFMFPRFLGANFIGLLPLVTQEITWLFPLRLDWGKIYLLSFFSILVAFIYLTIECKKTTALPFCWEVIKRTLPITFYGLLISLLLSIIGCDILAIHFLDHNEIPCGTYPYKGVLGLIYPKIVVLFAFSSFLIGIFVQIFWEEKTVTEPL